jgi:AcrR family transcriptional regulator
MKKSIEAKERIIDATIILINEGEGDVSAINMRAIAEKANVGIGMVNYHFQTKERLVEICVERIIGREISAFSPDVPEGMHSPIERAKYTAKLVADFLFSNPSVSRISILSDLKSSKDDDNTMRSVFGLGATLKELPVPEQEWQLMAFTIVSTMQTMFLRPQLFGLDMTVKEQRDRAIEQLVDRTLGYVGRGGER